MTASTRLGATVLTVAGFLVPGASLRAQEPGLPLGSAAAIGDVEPAGVPSAPDARSVGREAAPSSTALEQSVWRSPGLSPPRVRRAYRAKSTVVQQLFADAGITRPAEVFFRVFKREQMLEVWARDESSPRFVLLKSYPICRVSGRLGPKRKRGDLQVPEGFYTIDTFNPASRFLLSMRVSYPNAVDRARGASGDLGGDIYVHGGCSSIGCIAVGNDWIQELYIIGLAARDAGQRRIPIHIFPARLDDDGLRWLARNYSRRYIDFPFWESLQPGYLAFERTHRLPRIDAVNGRYVLRSTPAPVLGAPADARTAVADAAASPPPS